MTYSTGSGFSLKRGVADIKVTFDNGVSALATGDTGTYYTISHEAKIVGWYLNANASGNVVLDVWKKTGGIPTNADSICGTEKPTLSAAQQASDTDLTTWLNQLLPGDTLGFEVESATVTKVVLTLKLDI